MPAKGTRPPPTATPQALGHEGRATEEDHQSLRLWLRLLSCTQQIEDELRRRLRLRFGMSLARFDYMAQLHRHPEGLSMRALSHYLMVTGGNITGLTNELEKEGWVSREVDAADRRSYRLTLTAAGRRVFEEVAVVHESWVVSLFAGLRAAERRQLSALLGQLRGHVAASVGETPDAESVGDGKSEATAARRQPGRGRLLPP